MWGQGEVGAGSAGRAGRGAAGGEVESLKFTSNGRQERRQKKAQ
jgi:hypothetical protein